MNPPAQNQPRLLPFDREFPGAWQIWEEFWEDFLNANPLLPWPGQPFRFKRSTFAEPWGVGGGSQDGIDVRAHMKGGAILGVQCKNWKTIELSKVKKAMDKAEKEFKQAQAYFLVFTAEKISNEIQKEAERRGNWKIIGRKALSSWFFAGKFLDIDAQKGLVKQYFGTDWLRQLFPLSSDEVLIAPSKFFNAKNLIRHDATLQGKPFKALAELLAEAVGEGRPRITILYAPGGQGKTRLLKAVAEEVESRYPQRKVFFHNDAAGADAEDYKLRGADFKDLCLFIDDAHRLENLRKRLLQTMQECGTASALIATRPNNISALETRLEECGFREGDWRKHEVPILDHAGRRALAVEILGNDDGRTPDFLADESERCPLICTVGADLVRNGGIGTEVPKSEEFRRLVFDHLMVSSLDHLFADDPEYRKISERCLRAIALLSPLEKSDEVPELLARIIEGKAIDVDPILSRLEETGLLRTSRTMLRVVPDLLSDHLVYETAYGTDKHRVLVRKLIQEANEDGFTMIFANLAEAEWRARQEGRSATFLRDMWETLRKILRDPEDRRIHGLLDTWRKIAIFQPERTLELAQMILDHNTDRIIRNAPEVRFKGDRYDSIALYLGKLPDMLAPVASQHPDHRLAAAELLWRIGLRQDSPSDPRDEIPRAWQVISSTSSMDHWEKSGPQDILGWLKSWAQRTDGKQVLDKGGVFPSRAASQWFVSRNLRWKEVQAIREFPTEIDGFRREALDWIGMEIIPMGVGPSWAMLQVIFAACRTPSASVRSRAQGLLSQILKTHDDSLIRVSIWRHLSEQVAHEELEDWKTQWLEIRDSITVDLSFQLVRLASGYATQEWNRERMKKRERDNDYETSGQWWQELASLTTAELRKKFPSIRLSMEQLDMVSESQAQFGQRTSWDGVAEAWSKKFPEERGEVLEELMEHPNHALVPYLGYFTGLRDETDNEWAEDQILAALEHADDRVRRSALQRLSWRDVRWRDRVAARLREMAASDAPGLLDSITWFVSWNRHDANPYLDDVLAAMNYGVLAGVELARMTEAVGYLTEYANQKVEMQSLDSLFRRLEREKDLNQVFTDHALAIFHEKFPLEMFTVHRARARAGEFMPWLFDGWSLSGLPEKLGDAEFERIARDLLVEALRADEGQFARLRDLFDVSVARVNPQLAARLLVAELREASHNERTLKRLVKLTGNGHGSVVYEAPDFAKELLQEINRLPRAEAKDLRWNLLFAAVPHSWSSTGAGIDEEYLWAKKKAAPLAEHFRSDPILRDFYLEIVKYQEDDEVRERMRALDDE